MKAAKKPPKTEKKTVCVLIYDGKVALRRRPASGLLAGMWELPHWEGHHGANEMKGLLATSGIQAGEMKPLPPARHIFTHRVWEMEGLAVHCQADVLPEGWVWVSLEELAEQYALPGAFCLFCPVAAGTYRAVIHGPIKPMKGRFCWSIQLSSIVMPRDSGTESPLGWDICPSPLPLA